MVDGDTIEVSIEGVTFKVRYIGMDTPETSDPTKGKDCFGKQAAQHNKELLEGQTLYLERDVSETDRYGRLLRYVWLPDGSMVNETLLSDGYAQVTTFPPDMKYVVRFVKAQAEAKDANRGLWGHCIDDIPPTMAPTPLVQHVPTLTPRSAPRPTATPDLDALMHCLLPDSGESIRDLSPEAARELASLLADAKRAFEGRVDLGCDGP